MVRRSLKATPDGIEKARIALTGKGWSYEKLAEAVGLSTRQPIGNFFALKGVASDNFVRICQVLELNWLEIACQAQSTANDSSPEEASTSTSIDTLVQEVSNEEKPHIQVGIGNYNESIKGHYTQGNVFQGNTIYINKSDGIAQPLPTPLNEDHSIDIETLVQEVREKVKPYIKERCGTMRVLDMTQPIGLGDIYTDVNILEKITGRIRREIGELLQNFTTENFDRFGLGKVTQKRVPGLQAVQQHNKLMVLGKPGAGKTTFLKYLAIQCIEGEFQPNRVPIFIMLKRFAETQNQLDLWEFITQQLTNNCNLITNTQTHIIELLSAGKFLILLDGLDEVRQEDSSRVINHIKDFSEQYHNNQFVVTCRIADREYTYENFTEVEVADFDDKQIRTFVIKWFQQKNDEDVSKRFIQQLESNEPIKELANNPLLLTLLCLEFGDSCDFPSDRAELYNRAIHTLLRKWDAKRNIKREEVYKNLSVRNKETLLSQIGWNTFERNDYFFKQRDIERRITDFIRNLPEAKDDLEALQLDSELVLKSIEEQHGILVERATGIYSFSHLTFQEYFSARKIAYSANQKENLQSLVEHITERRWREVFLLCATMLQNADELLILMQRKINSILEGDNKLQQFLSWTNQKSHSQEVSYKPAAVRAFYLALDFALYRDRDLSLSFTLYRALDHDRDRDLAFYPALDLALDLALYRVLDLALDCSLDRDHELYCNIALDRDRNCALDLALDRSRDFNEELERALQQLKDQSPNPEDEKVYKQWWQKNSKVWTQQLRSVINQHRHIGYDWQFSDKHKELLQNYYDANKLLVDCLNSDCYVSRQVRQQIEDTLLLPVSNNQ